ncbi:MAG: riboflavin synthase [Deltaproteobacteria bacterium]|nr:riboflavin synthase [Deltaproteobacteria bacterium]
MFTGLIERTGEIVQIGKKRNSFQITIASRLDLVSSDIGASISVDGVCLTAVKVDNNLFTVEVSPETLERTTLSERKRGDLVNLERALRLSDRLGGHLVTGHVDGMGVIRSITKKLNSIVIKISPPIEITRYLVVKGSVGLDGISLTINEIQGNDFLVNIIPHTAQVTIIGKKRIGDRVNIETDLIGKYVEKLLQGAALIPEKKGKLSSINSDFLNKHGFT